MEKCFVLKNFVVWWYHLRWKFLSKYHFEESRVNCIGRAKHPYLWLLLELLQWAFRSNVIITGLSYGNLSWSIWLGLVHGPSIIQLPNKNSNKKIQLRVNQRQAIVVSLRSQLDILLLMAINNVSNNQFKKLHPTSVIAEKQEKSGMTQRLPQRLNPMFKIAITVT